MSISFKRNRSSLEELQASLDAEAKELEFEVGILQQFLTSAPKLREESRYLIPPPEEMVAYEPEAPHRGDLRRVQWQGNYYAIKLVLLLSAFLMASMWFVERLLAVMR